MKISKLLATRHSLLRQAHLANLANAYLTLRRLAERVAVAKLHGLVRLHSANPKEERFEPALVALEGSQARLEEHFADEELLHLADAIVLAIESDFAEIEFNLEDLADHFVAPLRYALEQAGVVIDLDDRKQPNLAAGSSE